MTIQQFYLLIVLIIYVLCLIYLIHAFSINQLCERTDVVDFLYLRINFILAAFEFWNSVEV